MTNNNVESAMDRDKKSADAATMAYDHAKRKQAAREKAEAEAKDSAIPFELKKEDTDSQ